MLKDWAKPISLFLILIVVYLVNGREIGSGDTIPATYLPFSIIGEGNFDLDEFPFLYERGSPYYAKYRNYYLKQRKGHYVSAYPPGSALLALPVYLIPVMRGLSPHSKYLLPLAKLSAVLASAFSAVFLLLAMRRLGKKRFAILIALAYALGTSTWSVSSQALWQHGSSQFFLALSIYFLARGLEKRNFAGYAGFPLAFAVLCRPTNILIVLPLVIYILHRYRDKFLKFVLSSLPCLGFFLIYNYFYFGSPFQLGYGGENSFWTTPFWEGFVGIMASPSRGLLVYSPVLIFSFGGMFLTWRRPDPRESSSNLLLRYLSLGPILIILLYSKWFMWWGGHSFGPRLLTDITPFLALFLYPVYKKTGKPLKMIFLVLLLFSVSFQAAGAFLYNGSWNTNPDIDTHRERLWSWRESQLLHYLAPNLSSSPAAPEETRDSERGEGPRGYLTGVHYYVWYPKNWGQGYLRGFLNPPQGPALGNYSSQDPRVIEQHIDWSHQYGIDFWTIDWWPGRPERDEVIKNTICQARNIEKIKFCIFYESWGRGFDKELWATNFDEEVARLFVSDFEYIAGTYFNHPSYLKIKGRPVVILYATRSFIGAYEEAIRLLRQRMRQLGFDIYLVADEIFWKIRKGKRVDAKPDVRRIKLFDAITAYNMYEGSRPEQGGYADSSTFFEDVTAKYREYEKIARENNVDFIPGIMPGYNDRGVRLRVNHYVIPRQFGPGEAEGSFLTESIEKLALPFLDPDIRMILVTSWNEWNEGTQIEPTVSGPPTSSDTSESGKDYTQGYPYSGYGKKYLEILRDKLGK